MTRRLLPIVALLAATSVAGCGSTSTLSGGTDAPTVKPVPDAGPLRVTATDARLGDATTADDRHGLTELQVPTRVIDPAQLGAQVRDRAGVGAGASCPDVDVMPTASNVSTVMSATLCLVNGERADAGLPALTTNARLSDAAVGHSQDMVALQYFDHQSKDGRDVVDRIRATGYIPTDRRWTVGENLAWGTGTLATPRNIVIAWMNSQGHRENILRAEFREIGFGITVGNPRSRDGQGATYTTTFGAVAGGAAAGSNEQIASSNAATTAARKAAARRKAARRAAARRKAARKAAARKAAARKAAARKARKARARVRNT